MNGCWRRHGQIFRVICRCDAASSHRPQPVRHFVGNLHLNYYADHDDDDDEDDVVVVGLSDSQSIFHDDSIKIELSIDWNARNHFFGSQKWHGWTQVTCVTTVIDRIDWMSKVQQFGLLERSMGRVQPAFQVIVRNFNHSGLSPCGHDITQNERQNENRSSKSQSVFLLSKTERNFLHIGNCN